jgi:RimJ/RimL family protein N-acetyltransferase
VVFDTARLRLREFTRDDFDALLRLNSDPEVMWFLTKGAPYTADQVNAFLDTVISDYPRHPGLGVWAAHRLDTGDFIGWLALHPTHDNPPSEPELGYRLARTAWGFGFATEGCRALIDRAFTSLAAVRVWAETMAVNARSRSVMKKLGMRHTDTWFGEFDDPIPGTELGEVVYEITRAEWVAQREGLGKPGA